MWDNFEGDDCGTRNPESQVGSMVVMGNRLCLQNRKDIS